MNSTEQIIQTRKSIDWHLISQNSQQKVSVKEYGDKTSLVTIVTD